MFSKTDGSGVQPQTAISGILLGMLIAYLAIWGLEIVQGVHHIDFATIRFLSLIGLLVIAYAWIFDRA